MFKQADGTLIDASGQLITGKDGKALTLNERGDIVDSAGQQADLSRFTLAGKAIENGHFSMTDN